MNKFAPWKLVKRIILGFVLIFAFVFIFFFKDSEDGAYFLILNNQKNRSSSTGPIGDLSSVGYQEETEGLDSGGLTEAPNTGTLNVISNFNSTSGDGLNLLLINTIQTNGYVKELLTLLKNNQEGMYTDYKYNIPVELALGIMTNETGLIGDSLPKTFIPFEASTVNDATTYKFYWNTDYKGVPAAQMTLSAFDRGAFETINRTMGKPATAIVVSNGADYFGINEKGGNVIYTGPFQLNENETDYWSKVNGATNAGRTKRDFAFFIDDLAYMDRYYDSRVLKVVGESAFLKMTQGERNAFYSLGHNRGNPYSAAFGWSYGATSSLGAAGAQFDKTKYTGEQLAEYANAYYCTVKDYIDSQSNFDISRVVPTDYNRWAGTFAALLSNKNWYITPLAYQAMQRSRVAKNAYAAMVCKKESEVDADYYTQFEPNVKTLHDAIKEVTGKDLTNAELIATYGCNGDYDAERSSKSEGLVHSYSGYGSNYENGYIYQVTTEQSEAYKNKYADGTLPYVVHCHDLINAGHVFSCAFVGEYLYAKLLKFAGVGVDPTKPETYKQSLQSLSFNGVNGNLSAVDSRIVAYLEAKGATLPADLSQARIDVLNEAASWIGTPYVYGGRSKGVGVDCTGFVWGVYHNLGYNISYTSTADWILNYNESRIYNRWEWIPVTELQPGDIMVCRKAVGELYGGHAAMYLGRSGSLSDHSGYVIIDANGSVRSNSLNNNREIYLGTSQPTTFQQGYWYCFRINSNTFMVQ